MYTVVSDVETVVQLKVVRGVAFTVIWIIAAIRQNRVSLLVAITMLITGALGLCREHTKLCILCFCSAVRIQRIQEKLGDSSIFAFVCSAARHELSKLTPPLYIQRSIVGSCCHLRPGPGLACVLLTPDSEADPPQPAGSEEREGGLPQHGGGRGVGNVEMSGWMDGREDGSRYSPHYMIMSA